jgi:predicted branched-subunit amino acid permease
MQKSRFSYFLEGLKDVLPVIPGIIPFAIISGISAIDSGLSEHMVIFLSIIVYAGASQLAMLALVVQNASDIVIFLTAVVVNLRLTMYSAGVSKSFTEESFFKKAFLSYFITDQAYAVTFLKLRSHKHKKPFLYFCGAAVSMWTAWQISTLFGIFGGKMFPQDLNLDFAIPVTFIAIIIPVIKSWDKIICFLLSGILSIYFYNFPMKLGMLISVGISIALGLFLWNITSTKERSNK